MITFLFFTKDDGHALARSLAPLVHDAVEGHVGEVIVYDSRSSDVTAEVADGAGCNLFQADETPLRDVVAGARGDWLVLMEPGARLKPGWHDAVFDHMMEPGAGAAAFRPDQAASIWKRMFGNLSGAGRPLANGLVISKEMALERLSGDARDPDALARRIQRNRLDARIEPLSRRD